MRRYWTVALCLALALTIFTSCAAMQRWAAPRFEDEGPHKGAEAMTRNQCFSCHDDERDGAPKTPASMRNKKNCIGCHLSK